MSEKTGQQILLYSLNCNRLTIARKENLALVLKEISPMLLFLQENSGKDRGIPGYRLITEHQRLDRQGGGVGIYMKGEVPDIMSIEPSKSGNSGDLEFCSARLRFGGYSFLLASAKCGIEISLGAYSS